MSIGTSAVSAFEIRSIPERGKRRIFVVQLPLKTSSVKPVGVPTTIAVLEASIFSPALMEALAAVLHTSVEALERIMESVTAPSPINEGQAIRISLICNMINAVRSADKVQSVLVGIASLSDERAAIFLEDILADDTGRARKSLMVRFADDS